MFKLPSLTRHLRSAVDKTRVVICAKATLVWNPSDSGKSADELIPFDAVLRRQILWGIMYLSSVTVDYCLRIVLSYMTNGIIC